MNLPFDALLLKRRIAKLLSQNKLHGIVTRKSSPNNSNKFCTEIIFHNARLDVVTKFTNSLSLDLRNSGHGDISVTATVVTHDDGDLDGLRIGIKGNVLLCVYFGEFVMY